VPAVQFKEELTMARTILAEAAAPSREELLERVRVLERALARARAEAITDPLTGCLNRRGWEATLVSEHARCVRHELNAVVVAFDLDGLEAINDREGHDAGDDMLRTCAKVVRGTVRAQDIVARPGGDKFAVLAVQSRHEMSSRAEDRLGEALARAGIAATLGTAQLSEAADLIAVWHLADRRMLARKRQAIADRVRSRFAGR
jgi:diguanylate cyclase (GGDEF)-like protein